MGMPSGLKPRRVVDLGTISIASSGTESDSIALWGEGLKWRQGLAGIIIESPDSLTGAVTVEVSEDDSTWKSLIDEDGSAATVTADAIEEFPAGYKYLRVVSASAEGAERVFTIRGVEREM